MGDSMHQPRDENGRFSTPVASAQFEEFRRTMDHRFAAQKEAVDSARRAIEELTETHAAAHLREHEANAEALKLARGQVETRVSKLEDDHSRRLRVLEDHDLAAASVADVKKVEDEAAARSARIAEESSKGVSSARSMGNKATAGAAVAIIIAIFEAIRGATS
jgi:hypothetical protein